MSFGGTSGSLRTIWITIRALNYASRVFDDIQKDITKLIGKETSLIGVNKELIKTTMQYAVAGIMMATLSNRITMQMFEMAGASGEGAIAIAHMNRQMEMTNRALGATIYEVLKATGILDAFVNVLKIVERNKAFQILVAGVMVLIAGLTALAAVSFLTGAAFHGLTIASKLASVALGLFNLVAQNGKISMMGLAASIGAALSVFMIFYTLGDAIGPWGSAIISVVMAIATAFWFMYAGVSAATMGVGLILGAGAAGAAIATMTSLQKETGLASGTRSVQHTGLVYAHKGEVVYNPTTNRPLQVGNDLMRNTGKRFNRGTEISETTSRQQSIDINVNENRPELNRPESPNMNIELVDENRPERIEPSEKGIEIIQPTAEGDKKPYPTTQIQLTFNNVTINTKADKEELGPYILKTVRDAVENKAVM
jgi:hypothetical protein